MDRRNIHCRIFTDFLEANIAPSKISVNDLGKAEGCVVDVKSGSGAVEASSIKIDGNGNAFGEIMVPHCGTTPHHQMFLVTIGMELPSTDYRHIVKGCKIDQVHVHAWEKEYKKVVGSTHIHFDCDLQGHSAHRHCLERLAEMIVKLDEYATKTCGAQ